MSIRQTLANELQLSREDGEYFARAAFKAASTLKDTLKRAAELDHPAILGGLQHIIRRLELFAKTCLDIS